jgi:DNA-binding transcriptional ArsR family regulator
MRNRMVTSVMRNQTVTYSEADAFHAVSDPTRRAVLDLLRRGSMPAGAIADKFPVSRPAVSKHLRVLRAANLVREEKLGRRRMYHLNPRPLREIDGWLEQYRKFWQANLASLKQFVEAQSNDASKPK